MPRRRLPRRATRRRRSSLRLPAQLAKLLRLNTHLRHWRGLGLARNLALALALILALSFVPASVTRDWPEPLRLTMELAQTIRKHSLDAALEMGATGPNGAALLPDWLDRLLPEGLRPRPTLPPGQLPQVPESFAAARRVLYEVIYRDRRRTFYCDCRYDSNGRTDLNSCGLVTLSDINRAERVEAEHVFPASQFGNFRRCWRDPGAFADCVTNSGGRLSGRACCERVDQVFATAHNDLHNLVPAVGAINASRSNHNWGDIRSGQTYGACEIRIDASIRRVRPPDRLRGDIARIMLYMRATYDFRLSRQDEQLYIAWNNLDPPDAWEIERNRRIRRQQGYGNPYVENYRQL